MKNKLFLFLSLAAILASSTSCGQNTSGDETSNQTSATVIEGDYWDVESPDGDLLVRVVLDDFGSLSYNVEKNGIVVLEDSSLGFILQEANLSEMLVLEDFQQNEVHVSYDNKSGRHSHVEDTCNEIVLKFLEYNYYLTLTMRAYDDGYAFKYDIEAVDGSSGTVHVSEENTTFAIPSSSTTWIQPYKAINSKGTFFAYEEAYVRRKASNLFNRTISMPMIYNIDETDMYSLITESGLIGSGYYGSFLKSMEDGSSIVQTVHSPAGVAVDDNEIAYPFTSPWRVGITGNLKEVTESELVEKVYDNVDYWRPDDYESLSEEEKKTFDYDWVEADLTAWNWLIWTGVKPQSDYGLQKSYVDLAYEMGWKYTILDGGWDANFNPVQFKEFMDYADSKGVKVIVWCDALVGFANGNAAMLRSKLDNWKHYGIAGIKIDFFDGQNATGQTHQGEDIETIKWYETIYQECARREMIVNCHGANKPTGERRLYPNVLNREGVKGNEFKNVDATTTVNSMFTRMIVGPSDFTPVVSPLSTGLTIGHQMALAVLYESGTPSMADYTSTYAREGINQFYKDLPALWDDMEYLDGMPDSHFVSARKSGDDWYVAGITGYNEVDVNINFDFLDSNATYSATIYSDGATYKELSIEEIENITSSSTQNMSLVKNGGFVIHLTKNN